MTSALPTTILPSWTCPITKEIMTDPVMCADGFTYERAAIEQWLKTSKRSPSTGLLLPHTGLIPNHALRNLIQEGIHQQQVAAKQQPAAAAPPVAPPSLPVSTTPPSLSLAVRALAPRPNANELIVMATLQSATDESISPNADGTTPLNLKSKKGIDLVLCLDRSGSMKHGKLELCLRTVDFLIDEPLSENDCLSIITFDSDVELVLPLTAMDATGKDAARRALKRVKTGSQTNISGALFRAIHELADKSSKDTSAIILLTDGQANGGVTNPNKISNIISAMMKQNFAPGRQTPSVFTFGFGQDADAAFLSTIAVPTGGIYYAITSQQAIPTAFADCIGGLMCVAAQQVELRIDTSSDVWNVELIDEGWTRYPFKIEANKTSANVTMKDIYVGETRDLLFKVRLTAKEGMPSSPIVGDMVKRMSSMLPSSPRLSSSSSNTARPVSGNNGAKKVSWVGSWFNIAPSNTEQVGNSTPTVGGSGAVGEVQVFVALRYIDCAQERVVAVSQLSGFSPKTAFDGVVARHLIRVRAAATMAEARKLAQVGNLAEARDALLEEQAFLRKTMAQLNLTEAQDDMLAEIAADLRVCIADMESQKTFETTGSVRLQSMSLSHAFQRSNKSESTPGNVRSGGLRAPKSSYTTPSKIAMVSRSEFHFSSRDDHDDGSPE